MKIELTLSNSQAEAYIEGDVTTEDASFSHPFGVEERVSYQVENIRVIVDVLGQEIEVTDLVDKNEIEKDLIKEYLKNIDTAMQSYNG